MTVGVRVRCSDSSRKCSPRALSEAGTKKRNRLLCWHRTHFNTRKVGRKDGRKDGEGETACTVDGSRVADGS